MKPQEEIVEPQEPMIGRYKREMVPDRWSDDDDDAIDSDVQYTDRLTGQVVLRYDAGDPANRPPLGPSDADVFADKGLDIREVVAVSRCRIAPTALDLSNFALQMAFEAERKEEWQRGADLLLEVDILTYLGISNFDFENYREAEEKLIKPALLAKGFHRVTFSMGEQDSFGPLSRVIRAVKDDKGYVFCYG